MKTRRRVEKILKEALQCLREGDTCRSQELIAKANEIMIQKYGEQVSIATLWRDLP